MAAKPPAAPFHCLSMTGPLGPLTVFEESGAIVALEWGRAGRSNPTPLLHEARAQLDAYFDGRLQDFDLPLRPQGTPFQQAVWGHMRRIPYGQVRTYGDLAKAMHSAARAVGGASGRNPIAIVIPCHRVVGAGGRMTGYSGGQGVATKQALLRLEGWLLA
ncbi:MAG TPA: methylated-DNA--[protein]-cysteine S-methyltransferase [Rhodospirillales bacterium]|jgi:methylated-DNA-[protein]-cysteine S-methyltransferase